MRIIYCLKYDQRVSTFYLVFDMYYSYTYFVVNFMGSRIRRSDGSIGVYDKIYVLLTSRYIIQCIYLNLAFIIGSIIFNGNG